MQPHVDPILVAGRIALSESDSGSAEHEKHFWAFTRVWEMRGRPDEVWNFVLAVLAKDQTHRLVENLSAGPLESVLAAHGRTIIDRIESQARINPAFRHFLGGVWRSSIEPEVWRRVEKVRGPAW